MRRCRLLESTSIAENGTVLIISGKRCRIADLSFSDLEHRLATGQAYTKSGSGHNRVMGYRNGVMTRLGDLEASVWETLIRDLIHRSGEDALLQGLIAWAADNCPWLHTKAEIEQHALELHSSRIFENPKWAGYPEFNRKYRPEKGDTNEHSQEIP